MPDINDYHAFTSTASGAETGSGRSGCSSSCLPWLLAAFGVLCLIGKLAG